MFEGKNILITGGTGSFGQNFTQRLLRHYKPKKLIIFSRDEYKQYLMQKKFSPGQYPCMRYFVGDVRDKERIYRAFHRVDYVVHAAALKHVPTAEYNPTEAVETNVNGTRNVIDAAIDSGALKLVALSTDKAVNPVNLYGATKLCLERLVIAGNSYGAGDTKCAVVRYGNVVGSRGSVIPFFLKIKEQGELPITDQRMTRFWITLEQGIDLVLFALKEARGGEIFIPKIPTMRIMDLAEAISPNCKKKFVGIRPGEKLHEMLLSSDEARHALDIGDKYIIESEYIYWKYKQWEGKTLPEGFAYTSDANNQVLNIQEMQTMLQNVVID